MKICKRCNQEKAIENFRITRKHYRTSYCKPCRKLNDKERAAIRSKIIEAAKSKPCADCGVQYPPFVMDFDHRADKLYTIARMRMRPIETLLEEIAKCDVVCANCHRFRTFGIPG